MKVPEMGVSHIGILRKNYLSFLPGLAILISVDFARYPNLLRHAITGWWFQTFFSFIPTWKNDPIWLMVFKWVETTNWISSFSCIGMSPLDFAPIDPHLCEVFHHVAHHGFLPGPTSPCFGGQGTSWALYQS